MIRIRTIHYAAPPPDYFWAWSRDADAAEWRDGQTICLWLELKAALIFLEEDGGLPPLGAVLLILAACRDDWPTKAPGLEPWLEKVVGLEQGSSEGKNLVAGVHAALRSVHRLPKDLRNLLPAKCLLLSVIFEDLASRLPSQASHEIIDELQTGGPIRLAGSVPGLTSAARFLRDAKALVTALASHDEGSLKARLRTGLEHPELLGAKLPQAEIKPSEATAPLLDRLADLGGEAAMAAGVAKRAIAMLNFPSRFGAPRDLPVGGISDITNRGTIDRLLPGELAWDDLVLAARLVHNEALYFRREVPPTDVPVRHLVFLDRGLRLWGHLRVLSLGVALGLVHHPSFRRAGESLEVVAAEMTDTEPLDLEGAAGVQKALEALVPSAGPVTVLAQWWEEVKLDALGTADDLVFITAAAHLEDAGCASLLGHIATEIRERGGALRVILLWRDGQLEIQEWSAGGNRTTFRGELAVEEVLPKQTASPAPALRTPPPLVKSRSPFLFPEIPKVSSFLPDAAQPETGGGIGVSHEGWLMRWPQAGWGAEKIFGPIEGKSHWVARNENGDLIVISSAERAGEPVRVFRLGGYHLENSLEEIEIERSNHSFPGFATVKGGAVLLCYSDHVEAISLNSGRRVATLKRRPMPPFPELGFDGQTITLSGTLGDSGRVGEKWPYQGAGRPQVLVPESISLVNGVLRLKAAGEVYTFDPLKLRLTIQKWGKLPLDLAPLKPVESSKTGKERLFARMNEFSTALYEEEAFGILQMFSSHGSGDGWHLLPATPNMSVWHARWGLLSFDPHLRMPGQGDPDPAALESLRLFFKKPAASSK